jgi:hypothetical protein
MRSGIGCRVSFKKKGKLILVHIKFELQIPGCSLISVVTCMSTVLSKTGLGFEIVSDP